MQVPPIRGRVDPDRASVWSTVANTRDVLKRVIGERYLGGMSQRDIEYGLEKARGPCVLSRSTVSELTDSLTQEYEAFRTRDLRGSEGADRLMAAVYEPWRRWGRKTGVRCVGAIGVAGRQVLWSLSTANSERQERCLEVLRDLVKRGLPTPVTIATEGAVGLTKAVAASWPKSLRIRCWWPQRPHLQEEGPPPAWPEFKALVIDLRAAPRVAAAARRRPELVNRYQLDFAEAWRGRLAAAQATLNHLHVPPRHQQSVRTANLAEGAFEEEGRRTKVIPQRWEGGG